ncbi:HopJ type III effector protein [Chryseobacterium sp. FH1]|uniref:HopJ type III effector protein n=1 Tax=Chryseobacterium sp. FH1 TaxID=1233951 RepID=UPI0004E38873|nr:HopJ type III effector protein [Chryseobacterium sp. FH1]KFC19194.1 type III effector [Chryseobacterium sp. FH1]
MIFEQLEKSAGEIQFKNVIAFLDEHYDFTPTKFTNGNTVNEADQNNGSCKVFSFSKLNALSKEETLALFGDFYRTDVLQNPDGDDHQNIRNFMTFGWDGISFDGEALKRK